MFFFLASLYLSYLQVFHNIQMLPLSLANATANKYLTNASNVSLANVGCHCLMQMLPMCPLQILHANMSLANAANMSLSTVVCVLLATAANAAVLTYFGQFLHTEQVSLYHCKTSWLF